TGNGQFTFTRGLDIDQAGNVFIGGPNLVQEFDAPGNFVRQYGSIPNTYPPSDLALDPNGHLMLVNGQNALIQKLVADPSSAHGRLDSAISIGRTSGKITYTPDPNFVGTDSFTYQANDGYLNSAPASVVINVVQALSNHLPLTSNDSSSTNEGIPVVIPVL